MIDLYTQTITRRSRVATACCSQMSGGAPERLLARVTRDLGGENTSGANTCRLPPRRDFVRAVLEEFILAVVPPRASRQCQRRRQHLSRSRGGCHGCCGHLIRAVSCEELGRTAGSVRHRAEPPRPVSSRASLRRAVERGEFECCIHRGRSKRSSAHGRALRRAPTGGNVIAPADFSMSRADWLITDQ